MFRLGSYLEGNGDGSPAQGPRVHPHRRHARPHRGGPPPGAAATVGDDQWRATFESSFLGAVRLARVVAAELGEGGVIGFVLSTSVHEPIPGLALSNAVRPALAGYAKTLAAELGPRGIRVVGFLPAHIATDRARELAYLHGDGAESFSDVPLRRQGTPEEFGRAAAFLLSPAASYITGTTLAVDGGSLVGFQRGRCSHSSATGPCQCSSGPPGGLEVHLCADA